MEKIVNLVKPFGDFSLSKCPFCGSDSVFYGEYESAVGKRFLVMCTDCMASINPGYAQDMVTVQTMWNKRALI